jgi:hypothetical protein
MPNFLTPEQIADFTASTINKFKRHKMTDISLDLTEYVCAMLMDEKKVIEQGGDQISYRVMVSLTGNARNTGMFAEDKTAVKDVLQSATVPWRMQTTNYSYSIYEPAFQSDRETIIKTLMVREHDAMNAMFVLHEENLWSAPTSATDNRPYGIPYWITKDPTTTVDGGFNGNAAFGTTTAGIDADTYPNWRNWTAGYSSVTIDDLVRKLKLAIYNTNFQAPHPHPELGYGKADYQMYTTLSVQEPLERIAELRNDKLGSDVARYMNRVTVGGVPLKYVPYLEANDSNLPVYGVCWKHFRPFVKAGANMKRHKPEKAPRQHDTYDVHIDHWMNYACYDLRRQFVVSQA